jgi:predicted alpha/beta superfamily hydrolase
MKKRLLLLLLTGLFVAMQMVSSAQTNEAQEFLTKIGIKDSLYSNVLDETRTIYVQLPTSYNPKEDRSYPVVYILDGEMLLPTVSLVHDYYSGGFIPEMILVGISNANNRTRDLTTSKVSERFGRSINEENGEAANFSRFFEEDLIPFIEDKYPATKYRTLIGHSYGGLFTIYILLNHPNLFANYLAIDPSLDWDNQRLFKEAQEKLSSQIYKDKSLFISLNGQLNKQDPDVTIENVMEDQTDLTLFPRSNIKFSDLVRSSSDNGLAFEWKFYPRDLHGTIPFPSIMDGLIFNFEWYQMENTDKINSPSTSKEEVADIINYRAKKLENYFGYSEPPYPEDLLDVLGLMSLDMEQPEKAKMYFEFAIQFYPDSPNTYNSMSEYYEGIGDVENALKFAGKAYEISRSMFYKQKLERLKLK